MAKWNDFVGQKTALPTKTLHGPYRSRTVGPLAMANGIHFWLHFPNMGCSIQSSLESSDQYAQNQIQIAAMIIS